MYLCATQKALISLSIVNCVESGGRPSFSRRAQPGTDEDAEPFERDARSIGEAVVSEYLWWRGLDHVDYILATHP